MRRRTLLGLVALAAAPVAAGCTDSSSPEPAPTRPSPTNAPEPDPETTDGPLRADVAAAESTLLALYSATLTAHPSLRGTLTPIAEQHEQHLRAMNDAPGSATAAAPPPSVASDPAAAVAELIAAERAAADARTQACGQARDVELARLLALIAASEASHAQALTVTGESL
jgi:hypothetical protein